MNLDILKFKLQQALQNNTAKRRKLATSGRIEPSRLAHYKTSENLYSQPIPNTGKEYKCDIILDVSGSMHEEVNSSSDRIGEAVESVQNLIKLFHGIIDFRILAFANGFIQLSTNEVLSITREKISNYEGYIKELSRFMGIITTREGKRNLVSVEGGKYKLSVGTWGPAPIAYSLNSLRGESGERFIVFVTDGLDVMDEFGRSKTGSDLSDYLDEINGIDIKKYGPENYSSLLKELKDNNINILPIGIKQSLSKEFQNSVKINKADEIYEKTINFIQENFNN